MEDISYSDIEKQWDVTERKEMLEEKQDGEEEEEEEEEEEKGEANLSDVAAGDIVAERELVVATADVEALSPSHLRLSKGEQLVVLEKRPRAWVLGRLEPGSDKLTGESGVAELETLRVVGPAGERDKLLDFHFKWAGRAPSSAPLKKEEGEEELLEQASALKQAVKKRITLIEMREQRADRREQSLVTIAKRLKQEQAALAEREAKLTEREERLRNAVVAASSGNLEAAATLIRSPGSSSSRMRNPSRISKHLLGPEMLAKQGYPEQVLQTLRSRTRTKIMRRRFHKMVDEMKTHESSAAIRLRNGALKEIYSSETKYVRMLETCVRVYLKKFLREANYSSRPFINRKAHADVFGTFDIIYELHRGIQIELSDRLDQWPSVQKFGDLFLRMAPVLRLYSSYIRNFERAQRALDKLRKNHTFVNTCEELRLEEADGHTLESFLILPVQRLPRYQLLLNELLKHTPEQHSDFADLTLAQQTIISICNDINGQKVMDENSARIRSMIEADRIDSLSDFITDHSFYIAEGKMQEFSKDDNSTYMYYLFSDRLLRTQAKFSLNAKKTRFQIVECVPLLDTLVLMDMPDTSMFSNSFELLSQSVVDKEQPPVRFGFKCETPEDKASWIESVANFARLFNSEESLKQWKSLRDEQPAAKPDKTVAEKVIAVPMALPRAAIRGFKKALKSPRGKSVDGDFSPKISPRPSFSNDQPAVADGNEPPARKTRLSKSSHTIGNLKKK